MYVCAREEVKMPRDCHFSASGSSCTQDKYNFVMDSIDFVHSQQTRATCTCTHTSWVRRRIGVTTFRMLQLVVFLFGGFVANVVTAMPHDVMLDGEKQPWYGMVCVC